MAAAGASGGSSRTGRAPPHSQTIHALQAHRQTGATGSLPARPRAAQPAAAATRGAASAPAAAPARRPSNGAKQAAFLALVERVAQENSKQPRELLDAAEELRRRCDALLQSNGAPPAAHEPPLKQLDGQLAAVAAASPLRLPAEPFHFELDPLPAQPLSVSMSRLHADVQKLEREEPLLRPTVATPLVADASPLKLQALPLPRLQSPSSPLDAYLVPSPANGTQPAEEKQQPSTGATHSALSLDSAEFPALQRVAAKRAAALQLSQDTAIPAEPDPFPSLSRVLQMRQNRLLRQQQQQQQGSIISPLALAPSIAAVSTTTAGANAASTPHLHPQQMMLNRDREALVQAHLAASAAVASNCLAASSAAAMATSAASSPVKLRPAWPPSPSSSQHASPVRPLSFASAAEDVEPMPSAACNHFQPQLSLPPAPLSAEEQEQHSVQQLLRQQALRLILEQVQVRANKRARRGVFSRWIWRWKISRLQAAQQRRKLYHLLSLWRRATHVRLADKHAAATKIQSHVRRFQAMRRLPALQLAAHHRRTQLLQRYFARWMRRHRLLARWRRRWAAMLAAASGAARLIPGRSFTPFPARKWRSEEGTTAMADAYCEWRRRNHAWAVWTAFIVTHAAAAAGGRAHEAAASHTRRPGRR